MRAAVDDIPPDQLALLEALATDDTPHSGRTLLEHLVGTRRLLLDWGNPREVATGGLFHSIYGTQYFRVQSATLERRPDVARVAGEEAEQLAYLFCVTDRAGFFTEAGAPEPVLRDRVHEVDLQVNRAVVGQLMEIEVANVVEQTDPASMSPTRAARVREMIDAGVAHLSTGALAALERLAGGRPSIRRRGRQR